MSHTYRAEQTNSHMGRKLATKKAKEQRKLAHQRRKLRTKVRGEETYD